MKKAAKKGDSLLQFPCDFTIKIFGLATEEFEGNVLMLIHKHIPNLSGRAIHSRKSETGKYLALTVTVYVHSKEQLDNLYRDLTASQHVIMTL